MKKHANKILNVLFFSFFLYIFWLGKKEVENLEHRKKITIGKVTGTKYSKGNFITYSYNIDSTIYRRKYKMGYSSFDGMSRIASFSDDDVYKYLINKNFPVIFDSLDFYNSDILILEKDFKNYDLAYPDSLSWVKKKIKN